MWVTGGGGNVSMDDEKDEGEHVALGDWRNDKMLCESGFGVLTMFCAQLVRVMRLVWFDLI